MPFTKYDTVWDDAYNLVAVEMAAIRAGGLWFNHERKVCGHGLFHHYRELQTLLWPEDDHHRWSDLILKTILEQRITVVQGARDSGKTYGMAKYGVADYFCFPDETLILMSSTDIRGLELRVWGTVKDLISRAKDKWPDLPGNVVDAKHGVFTDTVGETGEVRDMRKGIICIPCLGSNGEWTGTLDKFVGIKQKRRRLLGDEIQFLVNNYLTTLANLDKGDFKGVFLGNPVAANGKALDKVAEPENGWSTIPEPTKTVTWRNKFDGITLQLVGTDSPNFDTDRPKNYPYLIDQADIDRIAKRNGKDSNEFWTFIMGVRKTGVDAHRVMTVEMCDRNDAFTSPMWGPNETTKALGIDAGYGGDTCETIEIEFGKDAGGHELIKFNETVFVPIMLSSDKTPEDQIAHFAKEYCDRKGIPYSNVFFEAGMRATLAVSMARILSPAVNAVNAGGPATERPVSNDVFIFDEKTQQQRLKTCKEHYSKFVTELWFSVRACVESKQARDLPRSVAEEFAMREWIWVPGPLGPRYELETKLECKERMGQSPNKADAASIAIEGARRLGFIITRLQASDTKPDVDDWLEREVQKHRRAMRKHELNYAA